MNLLINWPCNLDSQLTYNVSGWNTKCYLRFFLQVEKNETLPHSYQGIEAELDSLPNKFSPPEGCILVAEIDGNIVGCVALRPFGPGTCEMKRLFVKPDFRSKGVGKALAKSIISEAKKIGYRKMLLDTGDFMVEAQKLYKSIGFKIIDQYYLNKL